jgi:hypothetical protein
MSTQIKNAGEALDLARGYLDKAGYAFYFIDEVKSEGSNWLIHAKTLINKVRVKIANTGDLLELSTIDK